MGNPGSIPGLGRSSEKGNDNPLQYSCPGEFLGQRSLGSGGLQSMGCKELDTTKQLTHTCDT